MDWRVFSVILIGLALCGCQKQLVLNEGMVIDQSCVIKKATYFLEGGENLDTPVLTLSGQDITVDFNGATILGDTNVRAPDLFAGLGIHIIDGSNITVKNLVIRGFKIALMAEDVPALRIEDSDFSYNYRPHMKSKREREALSDWLSYHNNEEDEWLRYGSGVYLKRCDKAVIRQNVASQNQNALLMVECDSALVYNNRFTFNSGLGLGMYRCSDNTVAHNCFDFNIRGYSHGIYQRGQDSAGLLVYEQCMRNRFIYNSATHSGDGFFLWAGQETMDTGQGGCNDNLIAYNDFSYAPTNGIEVTFSSNQIVHNRLAGCRYGIWAGYSHHTVIQDNAFANNQYGVAFEHGNTNIISHNTFDGDETGIRLWERPTQPADWGFAMERDVSSRDYQISGNQFNNVKKPLDIQDTRGLDTTSRVERLIVSVPKLTDGMDAVEVITLRGRRHIMVNAWGPYNFEYPLIWLSGIEDDRYTFQVLGPGESWQLKRSTGFRLIQGVSGSFPDSLVAVRDANEPRISLVLSYQGPDYTDQFGDLQQASVIDTFAFFRYEKQLSWDVKWYSYSDSENPLSEGDSYQSFKGKTADHKEVTDDLAYTWWRSPGGTVDADRFVTFAESEATFEPDIYRIQITSDDGMRFYLDGKRLIDHWDIHEPETDELVIPLNGKHHFYIEHFEGGGLAALSFDIAPVDQ